MLAPFDYLAPGSLAGAVAALAATPGSQPLAGGQLLLPAMKTHRAAPPQLVDLRRIGRLHGVRPAPPGQLWIGALTTLDELLEQPVGGHRSGGALVEAARASGDPQFRNRATVGGCLATRRAAPHLAAALLVAEATLVLVGGTGERVVSAEEFYAGGRPGPAGGHPGLAAGEILTEIRLPVATMTGSGYEVVADRASGHPICGVAVAVTRDRHGTLTAVRIAVTGATGRPARLRAAERALVGSGTGARLPVGPARAYLDDDRASAGYRRHLTRVLIGRAFART